MVHGYETIGRLIDEHIRQDAGEIGVAMPRRKVAEVSKLSVCQPGELHGACQVRLLLENSVRTHRCSSVIPLLGRYGRQVRTVPEIPCEVILCGRTCAFLPGRGRQGNSVAIVRHPAIVGSLWAIFDLLWNAGDEFAEDSTQKTFRDEMSRTVLRHLAAGEKDEVIARRLGLSVRTCRRHIAAIMDELGASSRFQAGVLAQRRDVYGNGVDLVR
jgi:DNA-binding CsgD family transcriptional regulator